MFSHPLPSHPRRRYNQNAAIPRLTSDLDTISSSYGDSPLRKSSTFHSPTSPSLSDDDPILNIPSIPRRSPTCPKDLERILAGADDRIANILGAVERSLSGLECFSTDSQKTLCAEDLPVPRFMVNVPDTNPRSVELDVDLDDYSRPVRKHHSSDSGIGSTVSSEPPSPKHAGLRQVNIDQRVELSTKSCSGINGLARPTSESMSATQHALSEYACRQIQKYIILPIVREEKLKNFHPLVIGIPYRVARKEVTCLRDLEKVLLLLAPKWSESKASYINFCETSIQCIHTTVDHLNESDQRRPTDRPYTNGYFLDLVEQVRQYAAEMAASRARAGSSASNEVTHEQDEQLGLVGGLSQTGYPAELVRIKDGKSISLRTGEVTDVEKISSGFHRTLKRSGSEELDEDVLRSMARRRKSAQPQVKDVQKCIECDKIFKRPCDLTKHEKTHSRPWKCSESGCKYHEYGWPTEKERDRHMNDKHSAAPPMYKCQYAPCPYESKRESNCKQHMEKAHGWNYVRSKQNGKVPKKPHGKTPPTPQMSTPGSIIFDQPTPDYSEDISHGSGNGYSSTAGSTSGGHSASHMTTPLMENDLPYDDFSSVDPVFWHMPGYSTGQSSAYPASTFQAPWDTTVAINTQSLLSSFEPSNIPEEEDIFGQNHFDWSNLNMDNDFASMNIQLYTPAASVEPQSFDAFSRNTSVSFDQPLNMQKQSFSPGGMADAMLYSPSSSYHDPNNDETFVDYNDIQKPTHDFALFGDSQTGSSLASADNEAMFQDLSKINMASAWSGRGTDLAEHLGLDLMQVDHE